jgi:cation diffusion facilitator CzcD-associated flavoprotein CzcO
MARTLPRGAEAAAPRLSASPPDRFRTLERDAFGVIVVGAGTSGLSAARS